MNEKGKSNIYYTSGSEGNKTYYKVSYNTKWGKTEGKVVVSPEDKDVESEARGYDYAEMKAYFKDRSNQIKNYKARLRGMEIIYSDMLQSVPEDNEVMRKMAHRIYTFRKQVNMMEESNNFWKDKLQAVIQGELDMVRSVRQAALSRHSGINEDTNFLG